MHAEPDPRRWKALAILVTAFFMVILDASIVIVGLPTIQADLGFSEQDLQWVLSAYALTFGGLLLLGGRAADLLGRKRMFMIGTAQEENLGRIDTIIKKQEETKDGVDTVRRLLRQKAGRRKLRRGEREP